MFSQVFLILAFLTLWGILGQIPYQFFCSRICIFSCLLHQCQTSSLGFQGHTSSLISIPKLINLFFFFFYLQHTHLTLASILSVPNILLTCGHIIPFSLYPSDWHLNKRNSLQLKTKTKTSYINVYVIHIFLQLMSDFSLPPHTRILQRVMFTGCFHLFLLAHSSMHSHYSTKTLFAEVISDFHMVQGNEHFKSSQQSWTISSFLKHVSDVTVPVFFILQQPPVSFAYSYISSLYSLHIRTLQI